MTDRTDWQTCRVPVVREITLSPRPPLFGIEIIQVNWTRVVNLDQTGNRA